MYALVIVFLVSASVPPQIEVAMHGVSLYATQEQCERNQRELTDAAQALHPELPVRAACVQTETSK